MRAAGLLATLGLLVLASACSRSCPLESKTGPTGRLTITGSSTVAPLASEIAKRFESLHPGVRVDVQTGGSSRGVADARRGTADLGMVSRALEGEESDLVPTAIALDGVTLIVHRDNQVASLSADQVTGIYTGAITNWSALGGPDLPITVVHKAEGRSTLELFLAHYGLDNGAVKPSIVIGDNQQGIRTVTSDPGAIGYVSIGTAIYEASAGSALDLLPVDGVEPSLDNVRNGSFPLSRPLNLVHHGEPSELTAAFLAFAASSAVDDLIEGQFLVPPTR
jgi:phosphate transport system substrate-binding protein